MKNSDLFLELFDDDLLKPQQDKDVDKTTEQAEEVLKSEVGILKLSSNRTEFDICEALDQIKDEGVLKHNQAIEKHWHKLSLNKDKSLVHQGDTDSSEDEDNKYMDSYNYCEFGRDVKRMLISNSNGLPNEEKEETVKLSHKWTESTSKAKKEQPSAKQMSLPDKPVVKTCDAYADPFFGIRIVTPLISSQGIQIRMSGKTPVTLAKLQAHLAKKVESDFVVAGVIVRSVTKLSQNDNQYMIWEISDLSDELPCVSVFLFGNSYKCLWKTQTGTVVGILNPTTGNKKGGNGNDSFSISVKFTDQIMIWGQSKDYGICKSIKKSGEKCTAFVNKNRCEFCIYHVKKEYTKFSSSRSEIQPPMGGRNTNFLRNKVLGKNEVFYGGKSYTALKEPLEKTKGKLKKLCLKDQQTLSNLGVTVFEKKTEIKSKTVSLPPAPRAALVLQNLNMDSKILKSLSFSKKPETPISFKTASSSKSFNQSSPLNSKTDNVPKLSDTNLSVLNKVPALSKPISNGGIDHSSPSCTGNKLDKPLNSEESFIAKIPALSNPEIQDLNLNKSENIVSRRSKLLFEEAVTKNKSPKSNTKNKLDKPFAGVNGFKAKIPLLSDPGIGDLNLNENIVSSRSKLLFEEAVTKNDSPKNKFRKPSLRNPELNESPKADNESKTPNSKKSGRSKKELFPTTSGGDLNFKRSQGPVLSDPSVDNHKKISNSKKSDSKNGNKDGKDLQKMFKSLFDVASNQKKKTLVSYNSNISASIDDNKQFDVRINKDNAEQINCGLNDRMTMSAAEVRMKEKVLNDNSADSLKSNYKPLDNLESNHTSPSTPTQKPVYRNDSPSQGRHVNAPFTSPSAAKVSKAKSRALMFIRQNGPISKTDPNALKKATDSSVKKRVRSESEEITEGKLVFSELYLQLMKQTSQQQDLAEAERLRLEEEYFDKMGLKEQLEEKMLNTFKIDCKAVKCLQCKYIWFSAADICKTERHILKIVDTVKRFFKCGNCGNRTVSLHVLPMFSCNNCSSSNWQRAPMMREKIVRVNNQLSIRGGEQQFLNSQATNSNLNLLVPD